MLPGVRPERRSVRRTTTVDEAWAIAFGASCRAQANCAERPRSDIFELASAKPMQGFYEIGIWKVLPGSRM